MSVSAAFYDTLCGLCRRGEIGPEDFRHALIFAGVMRWFAEFRGYAQEADLWAAAGIARRSRIGVEALRTAGLSEEIIGAVLLEKVADADAQAPLTMDEQLGCLLVTLDQLSALVVASAAARPKGSVKGMKVSAVQKKFRDSRFEPGINRMMILQGARRMRWEIGDLTSKTIKAVLSCEEEVQEAVREIA